jgi:transposase
MARVRSWAGLDVHAATVIAVTVDGESGELRARRLSGGTAEVVALCAGLPGPTRVACEAGPTGFGLARALEAAGVGCVVAAPGKIERPAADRVKTDRRDAERLVRLLMVGGLHAVRVPTSEEEALRDLVRAREDVRGDPMRARHRMGKLLLRHDVRYDGAGDNRTTRHRTWLGRVELGDRGAQVTLHDYLGAIDALVIRRDALEATIAELVPASPWAQTVARLRCLRGVDTLTAVGLCAEIGDFERFARAGQLASYLGVVPSEDSSGQRRRLGAITKTGSRHARRLLVEAARHYRRPPRRGGALAARQAGQPARARTRMEGPAAPTPQLAPTRPPARQAPHAGRGRRRRGTRRLLLGNRPRRLTSPRTTSVKEAAGTPGHHAREHPRLRYEHRPWRPRSILDSGLSRRNPVLRPPGSAHISLTARRAPTGPAAPLTDTRARSQRARGAGPLTNQPPYQRTGTTKGRATAAL